MQIKQKNGLVKSERGILQRKLLIRLLFILGVSLVFSVGLYVFLTKNTRNRVISGYINEKSISAISSFEEKKLIIEQNLQLFTKWGKNGLIDLSDTSNIGLAFIPLMEEAKNIYAISLFEEKGNEYEIKKEGDGYLSRFYSAANKDTEKAFIWEKMDSTGLVTGVWNGSVDFEPAKAAWITSIDKDTAKINWYGPYFSKSLNKNVISISSAWNNKGRTRYVVVHVLLKDVFGFIDDIELGEHEHMFLLNKIGDIYNFSDKKNVDETSRNISGSLTIPYYKSTVPEILKSVNVWLDTDKDIKNIMQFRAGGISYRSKFEYLNKNQKKYVLAIVVSENNFKVKLGNGKFILLSWSLLVFFAGVIVSLFVIIRYNRLLRKTPKPKISINYFEQDVRLLSQMPESKTLEFKSTIRFNLHAEKNDKAIEHAWLKGVAAFLNTDGGILLLGVSDDGKFHGIEKDGFENLDKAALHVKNLVSKYIGVEYMKFVNIYTGTINDKPLVALTCKQSTKPAYLYVSNEEQFYIRIGPSSTKLTTSQAVEHIVNHKYKQVVPF